MSSKANAIAAAVLATLVVLAAVAAWAAVGLVRCDARELYLPPASAASAPKRIPRVIWRAILSPQEQPTEMQRAAMDTTARLNPGWRQEVLSDAQAEEFLID